MDPHDGRPGDGAGGGLTPVLGQGSRQDDGQFSDGYFHLQVAPEVLVPDQDRAEAEEIAQEEVCPSFQATYGSIEMTVTVVLHAA